MRQTDAFLVKEDRWIARVAAPLPNRARTVAWANRARILQGRASNSQEVFMEQEGIYVGIDVAKAQVDVAISTTCLSCSSISGGREKVMTFVVLGMFLCLSQ